MFIDYNKMFNYFPDDGVGTGSQTTPDFTEFGGDARVVKDLYKNPAGIHNLIIAKREANAEAKGQRRIIENNASILGVESSDMGRLSELYVDSKTGAIQYSDLDDEDRELAEILVIKGVINPDVIGMDEQDIGDLQDAVYELVEGEDMEDEEDYNEDDFEKQERLAELEDDYSREKFINKLVREGADPKQAEKLARLYSDPEYPEEYLDKKSGNPLDESAIEKEKQRISEEHFGKFRADNPWGFGQPQPVIQTHGAPAVPPGSGTDTQGAIQRGDAHSIIAGIEKTFEGGNNG